MRLHHEFLEEEVGLGVGEGENGAAAAKKHPDVLEALVQPADEVKDQGAIINNLTQVSKHVRHALELLGVLGDGQITLYKVLQLGFKEQGAGFTVVEELASQASRAVEFRAEIVSARSSVMVPRIQDLTTQSMRCQSGKGGAGVSRRI